MLYEEVGRGAESESRLLVIRIKVKNYTKRNTTKGEDAKKQERKEGEKKSE